MNQCIPAGGLILPNPLAPLPALQFETGTDRYTTNVIQDLAIVKPRRLQEIMS